MENKEELIIKGKKIECPICTSNQFVSRKGVLPSKTLAIFDIEWASKEVSHKICSECGYIMSFIKK